MVTPACASTRYAPDVECNAVRVAVVYSDAHGVELDRHVACGRHAVAEVDRHDRSAGIAGIRTERLQPGRHDPVALGGGWLECRACGAGWSEDDDEARGRPLVCDPTAARVGDGATS